MGGLVVFCRRLDEWSSSFSLAGARSGPRAGMCAAPSGVAFGSARPSGLRCAMPLRQRLALVWARGAIRPAARGMGSSRSRCFDARCLQARSVGPGDSIRSRLGCARPSGQRCTVRPHQGPSAWRGARPSGLRRVRWASAGAGAGAHVAFRHGARGQVIPSGVVLGAHGHQASGARGGLIRGPL